MSACISFSNDASVARPGLYVLGFRPEEQVERIVDYAAAQGRTRFAALAPDDAYGSRASAAWRAAVAQVPGATAEIAVTFPPGSDDPQAAVAAGRGLRPAGRARQPSPPDDPAAGVPQLPAAAPAAARRSTRC